MSCYFIEREKTPARRIHDGLAILLSSNEWMRNFKALGYF